MKTAIYVRVSTDKQSTEMQMREIITFLQNKGISEYQVYEDVDYKGTSTQRPALNKLLDDCKQGQVELIVVWKLDRLFRSLSHLISTLNSFEELGVKFVSVHDNIDLTTPAGTLMMHLLGAFAQFERDIIIQRVKSGLANARAKGIKLGPPSRISKETREAVLRLRGGGATYRAIALQEGISVGMVGKILKASIAS